MRPRHNSANQYTDKHAANAASNAGQLNGRTSVGAAISKATVAPIFTVSHTMTPTAETAGDRPVSRLVMPRANNAPGTTAAGGTPPATGNGNAAQFGGGGGDGTVKIGFTVPLTGALAGFGEPLVGRLLMVDARSMRFETLAYAWDPDNPLNGSGVRTDSGDAPAQASPPPR